VCIVNLEHMKKRALAMLVWTKKKIPNENHKCHDGAGENRENHSNTGHGRAGRKIPDKEKRAQNTVPKMQSAFTKGRRTGEYLLRTADATSFSRISLQKSLVEGAAREEDKRKESGYARHKNGGIVRTT